MKVLFRDDDTFATGCEYDDGIGLFHGVCVCWEGRAKKGFKGLVCGVHCFASLS